LLEVSVERKGEKGAGVCVGEKGVSLSVALYCRTRISVKQANSAHNPKKERGERTTMFVVGRRDEQPVMQVNT